MKKHQTLYSRTLSGFTLIELLVVIAIIAILAAILFPVFAQAKAAAKKTVCLAQIKEISLGSFMYANDYDDTEPVFTYNNLVWSPGPAPILNVYFWFGGYSINFNNGYDPIATPSNGLLYPYMKCQPIFNCPVIGQLVPATAGFYEPLGYAVNTNVISPSGPSVNASTIAATSETILVADSGYVEDNSGVGSLVSNIGLTGPSYTYSPTTFGAHTLQANIGWCDGHAKSVRVSNRPDATYYNNDAVVQAFSTQNNVGDVINPAYPYGSAWEDYYYRIDKP
jgi:prepilin-type N-terminal cleavage/methylation domain-containing protein/prepilin-type processing-associated H-X9-DG protein